MNIQIAEICGLCAGCKNAIGTTIKEIESGHNVTIFKEIVHNKNVNSYLHDMGADCVENIEELNNSSTIIIRAHGEPPKTYEYLDSNGFRYRDCTCANVTKIHNQVKEYSERGFKVIIIGKYIKALHPEVLGTIGWASSEVILIETMEDISKLDKYTKDKFYLVCQTTFNTEKAEKLISAISDKLNGLNSEIIINKSLCGAQRAINESSVKLARECDIMIVVGGANSSNSLELYNNVKKHCPSIFIEDIYSYRDALQKENLKVSPTTKVGITAGASTRKEELLELKELIEKEHNK